MIGSTQRKLRRWRPWAITAIAWGLSANAAFPAQGNINFWGDIPASGPCLMFFQIPGQMGVSPDGRQLSSKIAGGTPGIAAIWSLNPYVVTIDGPSFFMTMPGNGNDGVTFTTTYSADIRHGTTWQPIASFTDRPSSQSFQLSTTPSYAYLHINVVANRPDAFPGGNYTATATVRCE